MPFAETGKKVYRQRKKKEAYKTPKMGMKGGCKTGSKIVQVKGVMPQKSGLTRQTPTGRAVGQF